MIRPTKLTPAVALCAALLFLAAETGEGQTGQELAPTHPKYRTTRRVFDDLVRAIGDGRTPPRLRMLRTGASSRKRVAWYSPRSHVLTVEERLFDLCVAVGPDSLDALAMLLGHELAHYYKDHAWPGDFGNGFADLEAGRRVQEAQRDLDRMVQVEVEADQFGGFYGHVAGYNTLGAAPEIFAAVYESYELADDMPGYPALAERQEIARRSLTSLHQLIPVFDAGYLLLLVGRHEPAARCFDHIAITFPSREVLNNAGVARALQAVALFDAGELLFAYPFELDADTRLRIGQKADPYSPMQLPDERPRRLLQEAQGLFERARSRDPEYAPALVNLACVADLLGEPDEALLHATRAVKKARAQGDTASAAAARVARGIARVHADPADTAAARADFEAAMAGRGELARLNLAALTGTVVDGTSKAGRSKRGRERIAGRRVGDYEDILEEPDAVVQLARGPGVPALVVYTRRGEDWSGMVVNTGFSNVSSLSTGQGYGGETSRGIRVGSSLAEAVKRHGVPESALGTTRGRVHRHGDLLLEVSADDRVRGWTLFTIDE